MKLVACPSCHAQYDVSDVATRRFDCSCGESVEVRDLSSHDAAVHRCGSCGAIVGADAESCDYCGSAIVRDRRNLSLICPECFARNPERCRFCTACGVAFQPQPLPGDHVELPCPCCGCLMPVRQVGGVATNECPRCNGLFVPDQHFEALVQRAIETRKREAPLGFAPKRPRVSGANPAGQQVTYRKCPVCEGFMQRRNFQRRSGVIVDVCRDHGTWLDADELEQIAGFILGGGMAEAQRREAELRREQERRARAERTRERVARQMGTSRNTFEARDKGFLGSVGDLLEFLLS